MPIKTKGKKKPSSLAKRANISYQSRDQGGGGSRVISWKDADTEVNFFQPSIGRNAINIIPFEIKSKNHPLVKSGAMEIGELDYCLDIWTHRNIGPSESSVICLKRTFGKACPICEEEAKLRKSGKDKDAQGFRASRRVFYNIEDTRKKPGELQVFEVSHYLFEKELIDEARNDDGDGDGAFVDFADPQTGSTIKFRCSKENKGGFEFNDFKSFQFVERDEIIDDELMDKAISFDQFLNVPSYEQVQVMLYGADDAEDDEEERPSKSDKGKKPARKSSRDEDDEDDDEEQDDEDDEEISKRPAKSKAPKKPSCESDEEDEDDEEERPSKAKGKSTKPSGKNKCPNGHTFGVDTDETKDCADCEMWSKCTGS